MVMDFAVCWTSQPVLESSSVVTDSGRQRSASSYFT